jgi:hypothetical protein
VEANDDAQRYRFLCGADMDPSAILAAYPGARFVARVRLETAARDPLGAVWGILIRLAAADPGEADDVRDVVADDGRRFRAVAVAGEGGTLLGEPGAILAAARYWELPPAYVRRLAAAPALDEREPS